MASPYLFRFAQRCLSPGRFALNAKYQYDIETEMVVRLDLPGNPPAVFIDDHGEGPPKTKKHDVEKGEDCKDRRMWQ